jgi:hypothetical protein
MLVDEGGMGAVPYRVQTKAGRVGIFSVTFVVLKVRIKHLCGLGQRSWRQRLHIEELILQLSSLEHLYSRIDR